MDFYVTVKCPYCGTEINMYVAMENDGFGIETTHKIVSCDHPIMGIKGCGQTFVLEVKAEPQVTVYKLAEPQAQEQNKPAPMAPGPDDLPF